MLFYIRIYLFGWAPALQHLTLQGRNERFQAEPLTPATCPAALPFCGRFTTRKPSGSSKHCAACPACPCCCTSAHCPHGLLWQPQLLVRGRAPCRKPAVLKASSSAPRCPCCSHTDCWAMSEWSVTQTPPGLLYLSSHVWLLRSATIAKDKTKPRLWCLCSYLGYREKFPTCLVAAASGVCNWGFLTAFSSGSVQTVFLLFAPVNSSFSN